MSNIFIYRPHFLHVHIVLMNVVFFSEQISAEATLVFEDVTDDFSDLSTILQHFEEWRKRDMTSYKDTYFSLCLPKVKISIPLNERNSKKVELKFTIDLISRLLDR